MAINTAGLAEAYLRKQQNKASQTDIDNLNYATSKGWKPTATPTATIAPVSTPPSYVGSSTQNAELNQAYERAKIGNQPQSQDLSNIAYAESKGWKYQPKVPSEITSDDLNKPTSDFQTGEVSPTDTGLDSASLMAGIDTTSKGTESYLKMLGQATPAENKRGELETRLQDLGDQYGDKSARELDLRNEMKVKENTQKMMDLNTQIEALKSSYDIGSSVTEGKIASASSIYGRQALYQRQKAVEVGALSAMAQAVQGNISTATKLAEDTANLEFGKIKNDLEMTREQIELNYQDMTTAEKKKADQLRVVLDERTRLIEKEESDRKSALDIATTAAANGADSTTMSKLAKAKTPEEALQIAGQYMADTSIETIAGRKVLVDSQGQVMKDLGSSTTPKTTTSGGGGTTTKLTKDQQAIQKKIDAELDKLAKGGDWGTSWNYLKNLYPEIPNEVLDQALEKDRYYPKEEVVEEKPGLLNRISTAWKNFWK